MIITPSLALKYYCCPIFYGSQISSDQIFNATRQLSHIEAAPTEVSDHWSLVFIGSLPFLPFLLVTPYHTCPIFGTFYYPLSCLQAAGIVATSVYPEQKPRSAASDQGIHCLHRHVCPIFLGKLRHI